MYRMISGAVCVATVLAGGSATALEDGVYQLGDPSWKGQLMVEGDRIEIEMVAPGTHCLGHFSGKITRDPVSDDWTAVYGVGDNVDKQCTLRGDRTHFIASQPGCRGYSGARCALQTVEIHELGASNDQGLAPALTETPEATAARWTAMLKTYFDTHYNSQYALTKAQALLIVGGYGQNIRPDGQWGPQTEAAFRSVANTVATIGFSEPENADPQAIANLVIGWLIDLIRAEVLNTDLPD